MNQKIDNHKKLNIYLNQIKNEFPEITWKNAKIIIEGCDNDVIILDSKLVFRFPKKPDTANKLKNEIKLLQSIKKNITLEIPKIEFISKKQDFIGYKLVQGACIIPEKVLTNFSKKEINNLKKMLAQFLIELHSTEKNALIKYAKNKTNINEHNIFKNDIEKLLFPILSNKDIKIINNFLIDYKNILSTKINKTIIHGDLSYENLLFKKNMLNGIIDFSDFDYSDPAIDLSPLWDFGDKFVKSICKSYDKNNFKDIILRSEIYYKKVAISLMIESQKGERFKFKDSYKMFLQRFN